MESTVFLNVKFLNQWKKDGGKKFSLLGTLTAPHFNTVI